MTIHEFAALCSCNPQTLRYYDRIGLLKPRHVDSWTGYRYYKAEQALDFIKIKNLQAADFRITEIRTLLSKSDEELFRAFERKIAEQEEKLVRMREIQRSYLAETANMNHIIEGVTGYLLSQLQNDTLLTEFGLVPEDRPKIIAHVKTYMEQWMRAELDSTESIRLLVDDQVVQGAASINKKIADLDVNPPKEAVILGNAEVSHKDIFDPAGYATLWEFHGFTHVYEFVELIPAMEDGGEYCFRFLLNEESYTQDIAFPMFMLGAMVLKKGAMKVMMGCSIDRSSDHTNHFFLMQKK